MGAEQTLAQLRAEAAGCTRCDLHRCGTQTVFGEGDEQARLVMVGEQPGDREDLEGRPFVGPAGKLLDRAMAEAGIDRSKVYVTNAVKHFKWQARGKRRIHQKPNAEEVRACRPWLESELAALSPEVVVLLGATAAQAVLGAKFRLTQHRGEWAEWDRDALVTATLHPSAVLRAPDDRRDTDYRSLVADLAFAASGLG